VACLSIFIGGLPYQGADEELLRRQFERFGRIDNVRIIRDKATGLGKGFGYVQFDQESCVMRAVDAARAGTLCHPDERIRPSRRSKYRNGTSTSVDGKQKQGRTSGLVLKIGAKSFELRVMPAMKKTELTRHLKLRTFINRGGADGLAKRTKRWRNRKLKREVDKESGHEAGSSDVNAPRTRWQQTTDHWKGLKKKSSTQVMTKGQRKAFTSKMEKMKGTKEPRAAA